MLVSGKSGTIVSASATGRAGQLKNDGSTIFSLDTVPSGAELDPMDDGAAPPFDQADAGRAAGSEPGRVGCLRAQRRPGGQKSSDQGDGGVDLVDADEEPGQDIAGRVDADRDLGGQRS